MAHFVLDLRAAAGPQRGHAREGFKHSVLDDRITLPPERIASANSQIRVERVAAMGRHLVEGRTRQQISLIDELIALLEERNLDGERRVDRGLRSRLRYLESEVGMPIPRRVLRARNTARMHGALLDWMETVVNELIPARRGSLDDLDAESA